VYLEIPVFTRISEGCVALHVENIAVPAYNGLPLRGFNSDWARTAARRFFSINTINPFSLFSALSTRNLSINNIAMAIARKRSSTSTDTPPASTNVVKKAKVTHDATPEPAARASGSPSRKRSGGATSTVLWIRNPPSHLPPLKENPWMEKGFVDHFAQIKVGPCIAHTLTA
jgi:hypothetical protein